MKRLALLALFALIPTPWSAFAQTVNSSVTLTWVLPTQNTDGTAIPTTGGTALANVQVFLSTSTIPATVTTPTATVTPAGTTTTQTFSVAPGGTVFARVKACNVNGVCSDLSAEVSKLVPQSKPGVPTSVTITIVVGP